MKPAKSPEKYLVDHRNFVNVDTCEIAYLLGMIWGDGYVNRNKKGKGYANIVEITLVEDDFKNIAAIFDKTGVWRYYKYIPKKGKVKTLAKTSNRLLCEYLESKNYVIKSHSTPSEILKTIPFELQRYFFLGLFDADGCYSGRFVLTAGINQDWSFMTKLFDRLSIHHYYIQKNTDKRGHCSSHFQLKRKKELLKLRNYLYPNGFEFGFNRKFEKLNSLLQHNINQPLHS